MSLSEALATLNVQRYKAWTPVISEQNARPAVLAFNGDVYEGLDAKSLTSPQLQWAQNHVGILSGLYGVLRPLDGMQPYRLEMGTALKHGKSNNLYQFWGTQIAEYLNQQLATDKDPVIVNLASQEYLKAVDKRALKARVVECVFQERKNGNYKIISFFAKRARGLMARYAIQKQAKRPRRCKRSPPKVMLSLPKYLTTTPWCFAATATTEEAHANLRQQHPFASRRHR